MRQSILIVKRRGEPKPSLEFLPALIALQTYKTVCLEASNELDAWQAEADLAIDKGETAPDDSKLVEVAEVWSSDAGRIKERKFKTRSKPVVQVRSFTEGNSDLIATGKKEAREEGEILPEQKPIVPIATVTTEGVEEIKGKTAVAEVEGVENVDTGAKTDIPVEEEEEEQVPDPLTTAEEAPMPAAPIVPQVKTAKEKRAEEAAKKRAAKEAKV